MKKIILLFTAALFTLSCSDDDKGQDAPKALPVASKISLTSGSSTMVYNFSYDSNRRIQSIQTTGSSTRTVSLTYNQKELMSTMTVATTGTPIVYALAYNDQNRLVSVSAGDDTLPVSYNEATRTYTFNSTVFSLDEDGDIVSAPPSDVFYETGKFGPMIHANMSTHLLAALTGDTYLLYFAGKKPMKEIKNSGTVQLSFENTFNESNYLTKSVINIGSLTTIAYEYTSI